MLCWIEPDDIPIPVKSSDAAPNSRAVASNEYVAPDNGNQPLDSQIDPPDSLNQDPNSISTLPGGQNDVYFSAQGQSDGENQTWD